jgi:hypothetical protein
MKHFEAELLKYLRKHETELNQFILNTWKKNQSNSSFCLFMEDEFLLKTGIIGVNTLPHLTYKNKYNPAITFNQENIYNKPSGIVQLSTIPISLKQAEIRIADHLIKYYLPVLNLEKVKEALKK